MSSMKKILRLFRNMYIERRLILDLTQKDFLKRFAGSYFGALWAFVHPLMVILVYWFAFQFGFRSGDVGDTPFVLWFLAAIVPWLFISESISAASNCFIEYSYLVKKVVFNIDILPITKILSAFCVHVPFLLLIQIVFIVLGVYPTIKIVQVLYYAICAITFTYALSLILASIIVFFRDLSQIISTILLIGMWVTPIAWNIEYFPKTAQTFLKLNPVYYIVEGYRDAFIGREWFWEKLGLAMYFWGITLFLLFIGATLYKRLKIHFADVL